MADLNQGLESEEYIEHVGLEARLAAAAVSARLRVAVDKAVEVVEDDGVSSDLGLGDLMWGARSRSRRPIGVGRPGTYGRLEEEALVLLVFAHLGIWQWVIALQEVITLVGSGLSR